MLQTATECKPIKHYYLRNSIAKNISLVKSIELLSENKQFNEGWILFRSLVDRLVYIYYLRENSNYQDFKDWTYLKTYESIHNARADELTHNVRNNPLFNLDKEDKAKHKELKEKKINWNKPRPQNVLKKEDLNLIYKFGYDYASMRTHPMYNDGDEEFHNITGLKPNPYEKYNHDELLPNSILLSTMILQETLNSYDFKFITLIYNLLDELRKEIRMNDNNSLEKFVALINYIQEGGNAFQK